MGTLELVIGVLLVAAFLLGLFWVWGDQERRTGRWDRWLGGDLWRRITIWTAVLAAAATVGAVLGGSGEFAGAVAVIGLVLVAVAARFWGLGRMFRD